MESTKESLDELLPPELQRGTMEGGIQNGETLAHKQTSEMIKLPSNLLILIAKTYCKYLSFPL